MGKAHLEGEVWPWSLARSSLSDRREAALITREPLTSEEERHLLCPVCKVWVPSFGNCHQDGKKWVLIMVWGKLRAEESGPRSLAATMCDLSCSSQKSPDPLPFVTSSRALYDRLAEVEHELSFKKDDILYVDDTLPQGTFGSWMAWQLDENAQKIQRGQIPSKYV